MKIYISFGQDHVHRVNGTTFDCDCLCMIECDSHMDGRAKAFEAFGPKFFTSYEEDQLEDQLKYFPRGVVPLTGEKS